MVEFTHISDGRAQMVDISAKTDVVREAVATGRIYLRPATLAAIREGTVIKGNVLATARVAATLAVKETPRIIPMCHAILLGAIAIDFMEGDGFIEAVVRTKSTGQNRGGDGSPDRCLRRAPYHLGHGQVRGKGRTRPVSGHTDRRHPCYGKKQRDDTGRCVMVA